MGTMYSTEMGRKADLTALGGVSECDELVQHGTAMSLRHRLLADQPRIDLPIRNAEQTLEFIKF
jgi:hypothetical protein